MQEIDHFHFDNLIRNRIPFTLLNIGVSLEGKYRGPEAAHLKKVERHLRPEGFWLIRNLEKQVLEMELPKEAALVLLGANPRQARRLYKRLVARGYFNCYLCLSAPAD